MTRLHLIGVGVDHYADDRIPDLRYARSDVERWCSLFEKSVLAPDVVVDLLLDHDATRTRVMDTLGRRLPERVTEDDIVIIYFAGHGSPELDARTDTMSRFLVCHDTELNSLFATGLDTLHDLTRILDRIRARLTVFVLDACFSGLTGGRGIVGPRLAELRRLHHPAVRLGDLYTGSGAIYLSAAGDDEVAFEKSTLRQGVFSYHLAKSLLAEQERPTVSISRLYGDTHAAVREFTNGQQNPMMWGVASGAALPNPSASRNWS